jgi:hypothetical protein
LNPPEGNVKYTLHFVKRRLPRFDAWGRPLDLAEGPKTFTFSGALTCEALNVCLLATADGVRCLGPA